MIVLLIFLLLKSQFRKSYNSLKETSNIENTFYFENKLKELQKSFVEWPLASQIIFISLMSKEDLMGFLLFMNSNLTYFEIYIGGSTNAA